MAIHLTAKRVAKLLRQPGRHRDALVKGLLLVVVNENNASWTLRYRRHGRERWLGLGPVSLVTLAMARERARAARLLLLDGTDPIAAKRRPPSKTFAATAQDYFAAHHTRWRNARHAAQFLSSLKSYAFPIIGELDITAVDKAAVLRVLEQNHHGQRLWDAVPETASRVRKRIAAVLDFAAVRDLRIGDNPARWKGFLDKLLPPQRRNTQHHAAMRYAALPAFMAALRDRNGNDARALEFLILTVARSGEVLGAQWSEIDLTNKVWTVPAGRIKSGREHRVPLSDRVVTLLQTLPREQDNNFVFIGHKRDGLGAIAMFELLRRLGQHDITVHGFRSSFRDWAEERTNATHAAIEQSLAHTVGSTVERAYRRSDLLELRRKLMTQWATYCAGTVAAVLPLVRR
jgi:integrase